MATEEQLKVTIQTVADTAAVQRYGAAVRQVQQQAQQPVNPRIAEAAARASAFQRAGGLEAAMRGAGVAVTEEAAAKSTRAVGEAVHVTADEFARFGASVIGVGLGLSAFTIAGTAVHSVLQSVVQDTISLDRATRMNAIVLGTQAADFQNWATGLAEQSGVARRGLLEAGTAAAQFGRQIGLVPDQVQGLTQVALQLSRIEGTDVAQTMTQLTAAMQGNAQAANALGLNLDDAYVAYTQMGGASAEVFKQLDPGTQATLRYRAALEEVGKMADTVGTGPVQNLQAQQERLNAQWEHFVSTTGPGVVGVLADMLKGVNDLTAALAANSQNNQGTDPGFKNEQELLQRMKDFNAKPGIEFLQQVRDALQDINARPGVETLQAMGDAFQQANEAGPPLADAVQAVQESAAATSVAITHVADAEDRAAASAAKHAEAAARAAAQAERQAAVDAATQILINATTERVRLQHEQVDLTAEEARLRLEMLPNVERMAALQRDMAQQQILARQAALPATEVAEDLRYMQQRATLIATNPYATPEERAAARGQLRGLVRAQPGVELTALDAERGVVVAGRAATRLSMQAQLQDLAQQGLLAGVQGAETQNQLLSAIVAAQVQAAQAFKDQLIQVPLTVVINNADGSQQVYNELIEANGQAQTPPIIQFSPLRRT
jgi:hypothetical protein